MHRQITIHWGVEDVLSIRPDLSEDQALDVLEATEKNHDCSIGINWDIIEGHASNLFPETKKESTS